MKKSTLEDIWYLYQAEYPMKQNKEINELFRMLEKLREKLVNGICKGEASVLEEYEQIRDKMECVVEKDAFIKGVKFAAGFLVEALDEE